MPVYCYRCNSCSQEFEIRHSMNFEEQQCVKCKSFDVFKIPSIGERKIVTTNNKKPGKIVDKYIEDVKKEIKKEKIKIKSEEL